MVLRNTWEWSGGCGGPASWVTRRLLYQSSQDAPTDDLLAHVIHFRPSHHRAGSWLRRCSAGFVRTERVCAQSVTGIGICARARPSADVAVFAGTAFSMELIGRVECAENVGVAVDID